MTLSLLLTNSIKIKISFKILISFLDYIFFIKILPLKIIFKSFNLICKLSFLSCLLQYFFLIALPVFWTLLSYVNIGAVTEKTRQMNFSLSVNIHQRILLFINTCYLPIITDDSLKKVCKFPPSLLFKEKLISWLLTAKKQYKASVDYESKFNKYATSLIILPK